MPVRNARSTVPGAILSTLRALNSDDELLVLDDGSTDGTSAILTRLARRDDRVRLLVNTSPLGVAQSLNILLQEAKNSLVARMDGDDLCFPHRFRYSTRVLKEAGLTSVFSGRVNFGSVSAVVRQPRPLPITSALMPYLMLLRNPVAHSAFLGWRAPILRIHGYKAIPTEDYELWMRLLADGARIARLARPGVAYRLHQNQLTRSQAWREGATRNGELLATWRLLATHVGWESSQMPAAVPLASDSGISRCIKSFIRDEVAVMSRYNRLLLQGLLFAH